jgi:hypothetical protein
MANTTNYNWETPDDTDLVKDGAAAIRTLGNSIDTTTKNLNPETTTGDIAYRSATANTNTRLPIGSSGQVLTVAAGVPRWAAPAGGGKVLQVVQATYSTATAITSTTATDSGLSGSITPSSASSKVLILVSQPIRTDRQTSLAGFNLRLMRGATAIYGTNFDADGGYSQAAGSTRIQLGWNYTITYLDSPATTSSVTYKTQLGLQDTANSAVVTAQITNQVSSIVLLEIGA